MDASDNLTVSGFQINDSAIYTIKDAAGELVTSGIAPLKWLAEKEGLLELTPADAFEGALVLFRADQIGADPKIVGEIAGQTRRTFSGPVLTVTPYQK